MATPEPILLTPPLGEPVSLAEAKRWLRVDADDDSQDEEIRDLIAAARRKAEAVTGRQLVSAKWRLTIPAFPASGEIRLPKSPLQALSAITYYDAANASQTLSTSYYAAVTSQVVGSVALVFGYSWPATYVRPDAVSVDFWSGYGPVTETTTGFEAGTRTVTPTSMEGIYAGTVLRIGDGEARETVVVSSVASTTFTATFRRGHPDPVEILPDLPPGIRRAIKNLVAANYRYRGDEGPAELSRIEDGVCLALTEEWTGDY